MLWPEFHLMNVILFTHATSVVYVPMVYQFLVVRAWPAGLCLFSRSWLTSAKSGKWTSEAQFANRTVSPCTSCSFLVFSRINIGSFKFCLVQSMISQQVFMHHCAQSNYTNRLHLNWIGWPAAIAIDVRYLLPGIHEQRTKFGNIHVDGL